MERPKLPDDVFADEYRAETEVGAWPGPDCPSTDTLEALLSDQIDEIDEIDPKGRLTVTEHLADCAGCAALVRDLKSLEDWAGRAADTLASTPADAQAPLAFRPRDQIASTSKPPIWRAWPAALAASLLLIVGLTSIWTLTTMQSIQSIDSDSPPDVLRSSNQTVSPAPGIELSNSPSQFTWPTQPGATSYRLTILDQQGQPIWSSDQTTEPRTTVPDGLFSAEIDTAYSWIVSVDGNVPRSQLGPYSFSIPNGAN